MKIKLKSADVKLLDSVVAKIVSYSNRAMKLAVIPIPSENGVPRRFINVTNPSVDFVQSLIKLNVSENIQIEIKI